METLQVIRWQHLGGHSWGCNRPNALMAILGRWAKMNHEQKKTKNNLTFRGYPGYLIGILSLFDGLI